MAMTVKIKGAPPKVLLVYPGSKSMGFTFPMGVLYVAQALIKAGYDVKIFHMGVQNMSELELDDYLFVGLSLLTGEIISNGLKIARMVKERNPGTPIVLGGVHPSLLPEESLANELVDIVVVGEGERTAVELAKTLIEKGDLSKVKGIAFKDADGKVRVNAKRELMKMDSLEFDLPYELLGRHFAKSVTMPVHTSRGCPYRCGFCYNPVLNNRRYRYKSAAKVVEEIEYLHRKYKIYNFNFDYEDEFFVDPKRAYEIFTAVIDKGLKIQWSAFCRFNTFDKAIERFGLDFIDVLKRSGCYYLSFGAESGSQRLLDEVILKDIKVEQIIRTIGRMKDAGIMHRVSFINCFPTETEKDLEESFNVIERISKDNSKIVLGMFKLVPLPGTKIYGRLVADEGFASPSSLEEWGDYKIPSKRYEDVTWLPVRYAKRCYNISLLSNYPFHKDFASYRAYREFVFNIDSSYGTGYSDYLMARIQRWRFVKRRFGLMAEPLIFNRYIELRMFLKQYVLKKYLPKSAYELLRRRFGKNSWTLAEQGSDKAMP